MHNPYNPNPSYPPPGPDTTFFTTPSSSSTGVPPCPPPPLHHTTTPNHPDNPQWQITNHPNNTHAQAAFLNHMVIPPPENRNTKDPCKTSFIVIDSASRNQSEYPEPNHYSMPLPSEIKDVKSLQLVSYKIPRPQCPVRATNNVLHYSTNVSVSQQADGTFTVNEPLPCSLQSVTIPKGTYGSAITTHSSDPTLFQDDLGKAVETGLSNNGPHNMYTVHIDPVTEQYTLVTDFSSGTNPTDYTAPLFFKPYFQGCEEYYNGAITEKVPVRPDPSGCPPGCPPPGGGACPTYTTCTYGKTHYTYLPNSIGPVFGHPRTNPKTQLTGVAGNGTDQGTLEGVGTAFLSELQVGDWLYVVPFDSVTGVSSDHYRVRVTAIVSDTEAQIDYDNNAAISFDTAFLWNGRITLPWSRNLQPDCYISMFVNCAKTLKSFTPAIDGAFYLVPAIQNEFYDIPEYLPFKTFSPILGRLDKLDITFRNADNSLYDFMGKNHVLLFKVVHYRQDVGYGDV